MQPVAMLQPASTSNDLLPAPAGTAIASVTASHQRRPRSALCKLRDVLKVVLRTFNEIRRLLRDSAAEIGEIVGGDLGREIGRIAASCALGLISEALLAEDQAGRTVPGLDLGA